MRVPVEILKGDLRLEAVKRLFPVDRRVSDGWEHWVLDPFDDGEESWEWLAEVFTGNTAKARAPQRIEPGTAGRGSGAGPADGDPGRASAAGVSKRPSTGADAETADHRLAGTGCRLRTGLPLSYGEDDLGPFAQYRLQRGEALYSAVVVRFTGQLIAKEVNATALEIAERSGIDDVTSIPGGLSGAHPPRPAGAQVPANQSPPPPGVGGRAAGTGGLSGG